MNFRMFQLYLSADYIMTDIHKNICMEQVDSVQQR